MRQCKKVLAKLEREIIVAELRRIAKMRFRCMPHWETWGPTEHMWDTYRQFGMPKAETIKKYWNLDWSGVLALADQRLPIQRFSQKATLLLKEEAELKRMDMEEAQQRMNAGIDETETWHSCEGALNCLPKLRPVLRWSSMHHAYMVVGARLVYEIR